jgi:hypothetical protein
VALLVHGWRREPGTQQTWLDTLFVAFGMGYLVAHTVLQFSVWDRYLLPLSPLLALLLARTVQLARRARSGRLETAPTLPPRTATSPIRSERVRDSRSPLGESRTHREQQRVLSLRALCARTLWSAAVILLFLSTWTATQNGYPIGGEHWAYQGLDQAAAYLKENAPADAVLYHHWLRWHYTYYLYDADFELRWWASGEHLRREVLRTPDRAQYIVLPDWRTCEPDAEGIAFQPVYETHRRDGSVSLTVYRIEPQQLASPVDRAEKGSE